MEHCQGLAWVASRRHHLWVWVQDLPMDLTQGECRDRGQVLATEGRVNGKVEWLVDQTGVQGATGEIGMATTALVLAITLRAAEEEVEVDLTRIGEVAV